MSEVATSAPSKVLFMGSPAFAVPVLRALLERKREYEVVAAVTQCDKRAGRGQRMSSCCVKIAAREAGLKVLEPVKMRTEETF